MAGEAVARGRPDLVYPPDAEVFTMRPPSEWLGWMPAGTEVFPYIYPPLWAWAVAPLTRLMPFEALVAPVSVVLALAIGATLLIARRVAAPGMSPVVFTALGLAAVMLSYVGATALHENQPQVVVALLTVAAIERSERGAPVAAGLLLALAAALKAYPVLFAVVWLIMGRRREAAVFAAAGAGLAALSVALAGWGPHADFLRMLGAISDTGVLVRFNWSLGTALGQIATPEALVWVSDPRVPGGQAGPGYYVLPLAPWLALLVKAAQGAAVLWAGWVLARAGGPAERAALWPAALTLVSLSGSLSWSYHYLAAVAFVPMLVLRFGTARGLAVIAGLIALGGPWLPAAGPLRPVPDPIQILGTLTMSALLAAFLAAVRTVRRG